LISLQHSLGLAVIIIIPAQNSGRVGPTFARCDNDGKSDFRMNVNLMIAPHAYVQ